MCHAGSVGAALAEVERSFSAAHPDVVVTDVSGGSVALARRLASGAQACDVYASADDLDIDRMLRPAGLADFAIMFAHGRMVLAYLATDPKTQGITRADWYRTLLAPGVRIGGAHPFLDPGGYRADMILQLAQRHYGVANLYNALLEHYQVLPAAAGPDAGSAPTLGRDFNFQFIYEHTAAAAARTNQAYRYIRLPDEIDLSDLAHAASYAQASVTMPGLGIGGAAASVAIPGSHATWGVTVVRNAANRDSALAFVALMLGPIGTAALQANGPPPITPALVRRDDYSRIPPILRALVRPTPAVR